MGQKDHLRNRLQVLERKITEGRFRLPPAFRAALAGALSFGLLAQGMGLFNKFSWHDDIFSLFMTGTAIPLGRWMLHVLGEAEKWFYGNGNFSLPVVNGGLSLLCIGLSAGLLVSHFQIRSRVLCVLAGGIMAVFPAVTSLFGFMYTVHYYMLALLMLTAGGILICGDGAWWKKGLGVLLGGCAIGVYQAFLPMLLMMVLMEQIMRLLRREEKHSFRIKTLLVQTVCVAGVMAVYLAGNELFLRLENAQLDGYFGIDQAGSVPLGDYLARVITAYREFFQPTRGVLWDMYPQSVYNLYRIMLCLHLMLSACWFLRTWKRSPARALIILLAALSLVPLGCNFIFVMSGEVHSLMVYGQVMQMLLLVCLADWTDVFPFPFRRLLPLGTALVLGLTGVMYIRYDNQCYLKTALQQQEAISWNTTLVTRIESAEGFRDELPVVFLNRKNMSDRNLYNLDELDFLTLGTYDSTLRNYLNDWAWEEFLARWCGFEAEKGDAAEVEAWPEVQEMPSYPDDGSIRVNRDTVVVKF